MYNIALVYPIPVVGVGSGAPLNWQS